MQLYAIGLDLARKFAFLRNQCADIGRARRGELFTCTYVYVPTFMCLRICTYVCKYTLREGQTVTYKLCANGMFTMKAFEYSKNYIQYKYNLFTLFRISFFFKKKKGTVHYYTRIIKRKKETAKKKKYAYEQNPF